MSLGNKIFELRKKNNLSQEQLGEQVNVTRQTISNWELGETAPNPEQLKLLSKTLNISIDELLDNDIKHVLVERVSNTEKLAGIVIKILKFLGIAFVALFAFASVAFELLVVAVESVFGMECKRSIIVCIPIHLLFGGRFFDFTYYCIWTKGLREMGKKLGVEKVHPHKFRRLWQLEQLKKECRYNKYRRYLDMNR